MTRDEKRKLLALLQEQFKRESRREILKFVQYVKSDYQVNWHHRAVCRKLDSFARGEIKRLMIFMPPRHGKSELVSRHLPAFLLGRNPQACIIATSYGADLASRMNRDVQRIIDSDPYRELFPATKLGGKSIRSVAQGSWLRNSDIFEVVNHRGSYRSAGVGGGITGMGGDFILIDDPTKNQEEALSKVYREKLLEWFNSTLYTRLEKDGGILLTVTRWHEKDLAGAILEHARKDPEADQWEVVSFPALLESPTQGDPREVGEALWPEKYSVKRLLSIKPTVGSMVFSALYQQNPTPQEGALLKRQYWKRYKKAPTRFEMVVTSWDMTFKETEDGSFVAGQVWGKAGADYYLLARVKRRMDFVESIKEVLKLNERFPHSRPTLVENKANGPAVISMLKSKISGLQEVEPKGSKEARAVSCTPLLESGNLWLPEGEPWVEEFIQECATFPRGETDDEVDAMTQAINYLEEFNKDAFFYGLAAKFPEVIEEGSFCYVPSGAKQLYFGVYFEGHKGGIVGIDPEGNIFLAATLEGSHSRISATYLKGIIEGKEAFFHLQESPYSETLAELLRSEPWSVDVIKRQPSEIDTMFLDLCDSEGLTYPPCGLLFDHMCLLQSTSTDKGVVYGAPKGLSCSTAWALAIAYQCYQKNKGSVSMSVGLVDEIGYYRKILED